MDEENEEVEDIESCSSDSFVDDLDNNESTTSGQDDGLHFEASHVPSLLPLFVHISSIFLLNFPSMLNI